MTLDQFLAAHLGFKANRDLSYRGRVAIIDSFDTSRSLLWGLDDYRVSSVSDGVIWLRPRTGTAADRLFKED
jgi:hypothetical protein